MNKVSKGQVILVHSHTFLPIGIQFMMNLYRWLRLDFKPFYKQVANHAAFGVGNNAIIEAIKEGTKVRDFFDAYSGRKNVVIKVYDYTWSSEQLNALDTLVDEYKDIPYEFTNFLVWPLNIITLGLIWIGRTGTKASKRIYCSELDATFLHYMTVPFLAKSETDDKMHNYFRRFWRKSPYQIEKFCDKYMTLVETYKL